MPKPILLRCRPNAQFHFGKVASDANMGLADTSDFIHSDTLFSALVSIHARLFSVAETNEFVEQFDTGVLKISSAFYCLESPERKVTYFLPKPMRYDAETFTDSAEIEISKRDKAKAVKRIRFLSLDLWKEGFSGDELYEHCKQPTLQNGTFACTQSEEKELGEVRFFSRQTLPKVFVHQPTQTDSLYSQTNIQLADNENGSKVHFYFLAEGELSESFKTCLHILADTGIGGERSTGCGFLEGVDFLKDSPFENLQGSQRVALGLLSPTEDEVSKLKFYKTLLRGGRRLGNPEIREDKDVYLQQLRMVREGAVLSETVAGQIVDIPPKNRTKTPFKRYGKGIFLPFDSQTTKV